MNPGDDRPDAGHPQPHTMPDDSMPVEGEFILGERPPNEEPRTQLCGSCSSHNPATNVYCEYCGAMLGREPGTSARTAIEVPGMPQAVLLALFAFVSISIALVILVRSFDNAPDLTPTDEDSTPSVTTGPSVAQLVEMVPARVIASSELEGFHASHLIDGDPDSYWNDESLRGVGAELTFEFDRAVELAAVELTNAHLKETWRRNYRIRAYEIHAYEQPFGPIRGRLDDIDGPQRIELGLLLTEAVVVHVTSTYPAEPHDDDVPFDELALAEARFFGSEPP